METLYTAGLDRPVYYSSFFTIEAELHVFLFFILRITWLALLFRTIIVCIPVQKLYDCQSFRDIKILETSPQFTGINYGDFKPTLVLFPYSLFFLIGQLFPISYKIKFRYREDRLKIFIILKFHHPLVKK
jgi:hypothetical protein